MSDKRSLIVKITELSFACLDLNLYLDSHPEDTNAINMHNNLSGKLNQAISSYEKKYGALTNFGTSNSKQPSSWIDEPWPWEREFNN